MRRKVRPGSEPRLGMASLPVTGAVPGSRMWLLEATGLPGEPLLGRCARPDGRNRLTGDAVLPGDPLLADDSIP